MVVLDHAREHGNLGEPRGADAERHPARAKRLWRVLGVRAGRSRAWAGGGGSSDFQGVNVDV